MRLPTIALVLGCMLVGFASCGGYWSGDEWCEPFCVDEAVQPDPDIQGSGRDSILTSPPPRTEARNESLTGLKRPPPSLNDQ